MVVEIKCAACPELISEARLRRFPRTKTCCPECSAQHRRNLVAKAARDFRARGASRPVAETLYGLAPEPAHEAL